MTTPRGRSVRARRKPQPVYDTDPLASQEQLSQQSENNEGEVAGGSSSNSNSSVKRRAGKKQKIAASGAKGGRGGGGGGGGRGRRNSRGGSSQAGQEEEEDEEEEEEGGKERKEEEEEEEGGKERKEEEEEEEEEAEKEEAEEGGGGEGEENREASTLGKRKRATRRASAPPAPSAKKAARGVKNAGKKGRGRKSTGDIGRSAAADAGGEEGQREEVLFGGGLGGVGGGVNNGLLEAVRRNDTALSSVVADWVSTCQEDSGTAMEELLNFILLASGAPCTEGPYRPPEDVAIADMDSEQWAELLEMVTDDMQSVPHLAKAAAASSFPLGPAAKGKSGKEARVFRSNYCEVFDRLVEACRKRGGEHDTETLEAVVLMLVALTQAASADVRLAATLAGMELGLGIAESLADLYAKAAVSQRQLDGAKSSATAAGRGKKAAENSRKIQGLESQAERISSAVEGLTVVSDLVYSKITQKRYRDVSTEVRSAALSGLSKIMLALPEVYVQDKLMRYHGWSLNDKVPSVRVLALQSIQQLLRNEASSIRLSKFSAHFFSRVKAMLDDLDATASREAAVVLRLMLSAGFLEDMEREDEMDIEAAIFEAGLALPTRMECMGFFVDRLEEFVETDAEKAAASSGGRGQAAPGKKTKRTTGSGADEDEGQISLIRLESLAQLVSMHAKEGVAAAVEATAAAAAAAAAGSPAATEEEIEEQQLLACADAAVQAMRGLPQAPAVRCWRAMFKLLDNDESSGGAAGGGAGGGALDRGEQTVVARMLLCSAKMAAAEAATGRKAGGTLLGKEAKQDVREAVSELADVCLTHLPNLLAKYQSDDAKLALLAELPAYIPGEALASLVSGAGKGAFSDLLSRMKDVFLMSNSPLVMDASALSLRWFLNADHAKKAEVQAMAQGMVEELFSKACTLTQKDEKAAGKGAARAKGRAWKDTAIALASCFRRLRCLAGCTDAGSCVDGTTLSEAWDAIEGAVTRRCLLDEVLPAKILPSQHHERLNVARGVVEEGCHVLYALFLWQLKPLFDHFKEMGSASAMEGAAAGADGGIPEDGDDAEPSPSTVGGRKRGRKTNKSKADDAEDTLGDGVVEVEEVTEERVQAVARYRDSLVEVLRAMLAMHLYPRRDEDEDEEEERRGSQSQGGDGIEGVPRVLTTDQKALLVGPARLTAWRLSNELQTALKEVLAGAEGPFASLSWVPDVPFTRLLQDYFEEMEDAMMVGASSGQQSKRSTKSGGGGGLKVERGEEAEGGGDLSNDDSDADAGEDENEVDPQDGLLLGDLGRHASDLLVPLMKSIYSNADKLNRRQAAAVVAHLVRSGKAGSGFAKCFVSKLREHSPVKCLEVHMATLRVFYDKWVVAAAAAAGDGDDDGDQTDDEKARKQWVQEQTGMERWLPLVRRLSMSLGVGPLRSKNPDEQKSLQDLLFGFMKVGVRFALDPEGDRLLFLEGVREYASKVTARQKKILGKFFDEQAKGLHEGVLEEGRDYASLWDSGDVQDIAPRWRAFFSFRNTLAPGSAAFFVPDGSGSGYASGDALSPSPPNSVSGSSMGTPASRGTRRFGGGSGVSSISGGGGSAAKKRGRVRRMSMASVRSGMSAASDLMPVAEEGLFQDEPQEGEAMHEEEEEEEEEEGREGEAAEEGADDVDGQDGDGDGDGGDDEEERRSIISEVCRSLARRCIATGFPGGVAHTIVGPFERRFSHGRQQCNADCLIECTDHCSSGHPLSGLLANFIFFFQVSSFSDLSACYVYLYTCVCLPLVFWCNNHDTWHLKQGSHPEQATTRRVRTSSRVPARGRGGQPSRGPGFQPVRRRPACCCCCCCCCKVHQQQAQQTRVDLGRRSTWRAAVAAVWSTPR
ncbi:unnamed protein product [Pylaiella littoralis]